jgi:hypothetical protein
MVAETLDVRNKLLVFYSDDIDASQLKSMREEFKRKYPDGDGPIALMVMPPLDKVDAVTAKELIIKLLDIVVGGNVNGKTIVTTQET